MAITDFRGEYFFLSNFFPVQLVIEVFPGRNERFPTMEHAYQYMKIPNNCPP